MALHCLIHGDSLDEILKNLDELKKDFALIYPRLGSLANCLAGGSFEYDVRDDVKDLADLLPKKE